MDATLTKTMEVLNVNYFVYVLASVRFYGAMSVFPITSTSYFGKMIKMLMSLAFALVVFPSTTTVNLNDSAIVVKILLIVKEYFFGFLLGYICSVPFWAIEGAGKLMDSQRGEQMGAIVSKLTNNPDSSLGKLLLQAFTVYFLSLNGMLFFVEIVYNSFHLIPLENFYPALDKTIVTSLIDLFTSLFFWSILLAMPIVIVMFLVEVVLGIISTFLPQLNVTVMSMPIKSAVGMLVLVFYVGDLFHYVIINFLDRIKGLYV